MKATHKLVLIAGILGASALSSMGAMITVQNSSFENPALAEGAITLHQTPPGVPNWTIAAANNTVGIINLDEGGAGANPDFMGAADGLNVLWMNEGTATQATGEIIAADTTYTLTVAIAHRNITGGQFAGELPNTYLIELLAGGTPIASSSTPATSGTAWQDSVATVDILAGSPHIGQTLSIRFSVGGPQPLFDNVRLDGSPVPEPASLMLASLGVFLLYRRRKPA